MPEWSKGPDSSSGGFGLVGSNPTPYIDYFYVLIKINLKNLIYNYDRL